MRPCSTPRACSRPASARARRASVPCTWTCTVACSRSTVVVDAGHGDELDPRIGERADRLGDHLAQHAVQTRHAAAARSRAPVRHCRSSGAITLALERAGLVGAGDDHALGLVEPLAERGRVPIDDRERQARALPQLVVVDLGDRGARPSLEIALQRQQLAPLALERCAFGKMQIEAEDAHVAGCHRASLGWVRTSSTTGSACRTSTLTRGRPIARRAGAPRGARHARRRDVVRGRPRARARARARDRPRGRRAPPGAAPTEALRLDALGAPELVVGVGRPRGRRACRTRDHARSRGAVRGRADRCAPRSRHAARCIGAARRAAAARCARRCDRARRSTSSRSRSSRRSTRRACATAPRRGSDRCGASTRSRASGPASDCASSRRACARTCRRSSSPSAAAGPCSRCAPTRAARCRASSTTPPARARRCSSSRSRSSSSTTACASS